jgi:hypothetical protein
MKIDVQQTGEFPDIDAMFRALPELSARVLGYLGKEAAVELAGMMERGINGITYRDMDGNRKSRGGRRMITYSVGRGLKWVRVSSFPLNFFEGGRMLRSGKRESPRNILRRTLASAMSSKMSSAIEGSTNLIIDDWFNKRSKGGMARI